MKTSSIMAALTGSALGHMAMSDPPALRYKDNPNAKGDVDTEAINPITLSDFPCHGDADLVGTDAGKPVADYKAGESYSVTISGGATHGGGSCQISLSYDKGETFTVIQSIIGDCPMSDGDQFDFTVPQDAPDGDDVLLSWSWINHIGNREFYQSCAVVTVAGGSGDGDGGGGGGGAKSRRQDSSTSFDSRPEMFVANIIDGCTVEEGTDVLYPDPGPDVKKNTEGTPPKGDDCGGSAPEGGSGGDSGGDSGSGGDAGGDAGSSGGSDGSSPAPTSGGGESGGGGEQAPAPTGGAEGGGEQAPAPTGGAEGGAGGDDGQYSPPEAPSAPAGGAPDQAQPGGVFVTDSAPAGGSGPTTIADEPAGETGAPSGSAAESAPASETGAASGSAAESAPAGETGSPEASAPADSGSDSGSAPAPTGGSDSGSESGSAPAPTGGSDSGSPSGSAPSGAAPTGGASGGSSGGEGEQSGECDDDGAWNCVGGNQFQRCASGQWTEVMAMADGTSCEPGQGQSFAVAAAVPKKFRFRRF